MKNIATSDQTSLKSEIEKANHEFMNAVAGKDGDAIARLYTENAQLMFPHSPAIEGRENIKSFFQQTVASGITGVKLTTDEVTGTDDFAIESGRYEMLAGDQTVDKGNYLVHWKNVGGEWLLHRDMPMTDQPLAETTAQPH
jgi:uncharacterized protein (TIGR02246 family)